MGTETLEEKENSKKILELFNTCIVTNYKLAAELCKSVPSNFDKGWVCGVNDFINRQSDSDLKKFLIKKRIWIKPKEALSYHPKPIIVTLNFKLSPFLRGWGFSNTPFNISKKTLQIINTKQFHANEYKFTLPFEKLQLKYPEEILITGDPNNFTKSVKELTIDCDEFRYWDSLNLFEDLEVLNIEGALGSEIKERPSVPVTVKTINIKQLYHTQVISFQKITENEWIELILNPL